jgi:two-component system sensor histidine kinase KdpD
MNPAPLSAADRSTVRSWVVVAFLLAAATAVCFFLDVYVSLTSKAMIYVLAVVIAAYKLDAMASAACAVAAVSALNFFFVSPRLTFAVDNQEHFIALGAMLVVALVISHLAKGLRRETELARLNERRARQLQKLATDLPSANSAAEVAALGRHALDESFVGPCLLALSQDGREPEPAADMDSAVRDGLRCCMAEAAVLGPGTGRWPGLLAWYLPLGEPGQMVGAAWVRPAVASDGSGREHAQALCALLAQALWRLRMTASMLAAQNEAQRQQLQSTFLAAISHDLRTPLAAIVGAASSLQTQRDKLSAPEQERLLGSIVSEASYLSTVTENTLQLVRLRESKQEIKRDWESMEEIVGSVLARVRQRDPTRRIKSQVPENLPLVKGDPVLLTQLISNLLDNALQYSDGAIDLTVGVKAQELLVSVKDRGPGITEAEQAVIFEAYRRGDQSGPRGAGLGLALCRTIAVAHGGHLTLRPRAGGGSNFVLALLVDAQQPGAALSQALP